MYKLIYIILSLLVYSIAFGQGEQQLLKTHYSKPDQPGGIVLIKNGAAIKTAFTGLAHVEQEIPIAEESRFRMASVSKQFTAMAVYLLIQDGKISLEAPVREIFPELPLVCAPIRIKHLINHSSGLVDYENIIPKDQKTQLLDADVLEMIKNIDTVYFAAGTQFRYSNTAYCLMSLLVERISNQRYEIFCKERIFDKLDMQSAQISAPNTLENRAYGYKPTTEGFRFADQSITSATRGDGGVYISARDFAKWIDKDNSLYTTQFFKDLETYSIEVKDGIHYGLGLFFTKSQDGQITMFHSGESTGFHNIFLFQPQQNKGLFLFTNRDDLKIATIFESLLQDHNLKISGIKESLFMWLSKVYSGE